MTEPHPQRCETCLNEKCSVKLNGGLLDISFSAYFPQITSVIGCASHSSQQSERDKAFDEIMARVQQHTRFFDDALAFAKNDYDRTEAIATMATLKLCLQDIAELRSKQGEP